jgi:hypothetical protein
MRDSLAEIARAFRGAATARFKAGTLDMEIDNFLPRWLEWGIVFQKGRQADWLPWAARDQDSGVTDRERLGNGAPSH